MMNEQTIQGNGKSAKGILFLHALTPLHPGSGSALGAVDLPVQRERHTQWPVITCSSLKGVIRDSCRPEDEKNDALQNWLAVFGPESQEETSAHAGALCFTDARILAFPVRSLKGVFAWITCPAVLRRFKRDLGIAEIEPSWDIPKVPEVSKTGTGSISWAFLSNNSPLKVNGNGQIVLEEFDFTQSDKTTSDNFTKIASDISLAIPDDGTREIFHGHFVILSDDDFTYFVRQATEVATRIKLNYKTKTVAGTGLFSEEFIPPEALFYSIIIAEKSRRPDVPLSAEKVLEHIKNVPSYIQLGGDATIGKGFCAQKICEQKDFNHSPKTKKED